MKYSYSYKQLIFLFCLILFFFRFLMDPIHILSWDVFGYYLYLPAYFIHSDIGLVNLEWLTHLMDTYEPSSTWYQLVEIENGNKAIKYTMGLSILYAPFFFFADLLAESLGYPADGLSLPYQYSVTIGGLIYAIIGLIYFSKVLLHFFNQHIAGIVLVIVFFGTNYFHLTINDGTLLSHNFLFTLYAVLTYYTIQWYSTKKIRDAIIIGVIVGFTTLIRPTEILCVLIPLLWSGHQGSYFSGKLSLLKTYFPQVLVTIFCAVLVFTPQMFYWKHVTGKWLFYSYSNAGEGLDLHSPHIIDFLLSFRKGWLIYTPIMLFSLIGFYFLHKKNKPLFFLLSLLLVLDIYISSSWTTWWYAGGSFSSRTIVPKYVLLAIPLGFFIESIKTIKVKAVLGVLGVFFITLNLFQSWQFKNGILSRERMTMEYYFRIFGQTKVNEKDKKLLLVERSTETFMEFNNEDDYRSEILYQNSFDTEQNEDKVLVLDEKKRFSPGIDIKFKDLTNFDHAWIKGGVKIFIPDQYDGELPLFVATFHHKNKTYKYRSFVIKKDDIKLNDWNEIVFFYLTPEVRSEEDNLKIYLWHRGKQKIMIDDLRIHVYEPRI